MSANHDGRKPRKGTALRVITAQVKRLTDTDVYALTFSGDRATRRVAMQEAHERAESYAMENS